MNIVKIVAGALIGILVISMLFSSCERIDAGHVGIKVNMYGDTKGVDDVTEVTGWVFYNPFASKIVEFPIFMQHKEYTAEESFVINSKDGSEFHVSPLINYSVQREKFLTFTQSIVFHLFKFNPDFSKQPFTMRFV